MVQNEAYATGMKLKDNLAYGTVVSGDTQATMELKENLAYGTVVSGDTQATMELKENPAYGTAVSFHELSHELHRY